MLLRKCRQVPFLFFVAWISFWGCSQTDTRLGDDGTNPPPPSFTRPDASDDASDTDPNRLLCVATDCPAPFATCSTGGPPYKCGTDLSHDPSNCGSCGNECLSYGPIHMTSRCVDGACELECMSPALDDGEYRNCNGEVDDGCEADILSDPLNCGGCGNACGAGEPCIQGRCGCVEPLIPCNGRCVDPNIDDDNCGGCGTICEQPSSGVCDPMPAGTYYGCLGGTCGHLKCGRFSADCNGDFAEGQCNSDGCEVADLKSDPNNCGGCGIKCQGDEECIDEGNGPECAVRCARFGKMYCQNSSKCADLLTDPYHCGGCENHCGSAGANQVGLCVKGRCAYECTAGFADCNGDTADGCEVNLNVHPANCGACGNRCDIVAGQPCVEGRCLTKDCEGGETK